MEALNRIQGSAFDLEKYNGRGFLDDSMGMQQSLARALHVLPFIRKMLSS